MSEGTKVFDVQKEIAELKRRVQQLENEKATYGPTYQPQSVPGYPTQPPIFGPGNNTNFPADWLKPYSVCESAVENFNGINTKETK